MTTRWALGIDIGGTFVDIVACSTDGRLHSLKQPRHAGQLVEPVLAGARRLLQAHRIAARDVARIVHGSTVVTNLLLEMDAPPVGVLTTRGLRDVLALARQDRRALYAPTAQPKVPAQTLFPQHLRLELAGRLDALGEEIEALDEAAVAVAARKLDALGVESVAVCLLFSHLNPAHELRTRELVLQHAPRLAVSLSHEVDPRPREFERFLATALDAYAKPTASRYVQALAAALAEAGLPEPMLMRSEGGIGPWRDVLHRPIRLAMSGPCAALQGVAASAGADALSLTLMAIDVGGTSTDIGLIEAGRPLFADTLQCGDLAVRLRCADVESLPVGGGSIARATSEGGLRLGPRSQGAWPGPAAYGQGGEHATLTDALAVLQRLPERLAGGVVLDRDAARRALLHDVARPLGAALEDAAHAVVLTAATAMAETLKMRTFQRGIDPADCLLIAAGGGGAQHAAEVAALAGMNRVRVLPQAGVIAALGLLDARPARTVEHALDFPLDAAGLAAAQAARPDALPGWPHAQVQWSLEICHAGQEFTIELPWDPVGDTVAQLRTRFEARHERLRGHVAPGQPLRIRLLRGVFEQAALMPDIAHLQVQAQDRSGISVWAGLPSSGTGPTALFAPLTTVWVPEGWRWQLRPDDAIDLFTSNASAP